MGREQDNPPPAPDVRVAAVTALKARLAEAAKTEDAPQAAAPEPEEQETKPTEGEPAEKVPDERISKAWAKVAKLEAKIRERESAAKAIEARAKEAEDKYNAWSERARKDPIGLVSESVGTQWYEDATKRMLADGKPTDAEKLRQLEASVGDVDKRATEIADARIQQFRQEYEAQRRSQEYVSDVAKALTDDRFELTRLSPTGADDCVRLAAEIYKREGKLLPPEKIAGMIEAELEVQARVWAGAKKLGRSQTETASKKDRPSAERPRTIGHKLTSDSAAAPSGARTPQQRAADAVKALRRMKAQPD